jgi:hypothetical protein
MIRFLARLRGLVSLDSKDSSYEDRVIDRCEHEWGEWVNIEDADLEPILTPTNSGHWIRSPQIESGHLVFDIVSEQERFCENCGKRDMGSNDGLIETTGTRVAVVDRGAIKLDYLLAPDVRLSDAITQDESGEAGRIIVNESEL